MRAGWVREMVNTCACLFKNYVTFNMYAPIFAKEGVHSYKRRQGCGTQGLGGARGKQDQDHACDSCFELTPVVQNSEADLRCLMHQMTLACLRAPFLFGRVTTHTPRRPDPSLRFPFDSLHGPVALGFRSSAFER